MKKRKAAEEKEQILIPSFDEHYSVKYYETLQLNYWFKQKDLNKNYESLKNSSYCKANNTEMDNLIKAYELFTDDHLKQSYLAFLLINYTLSQPMSMRSLELNFQNKIFPFYLFSILIKEDFLILKIDFLNKRIIIQDKSKTIENLHISCIDKVYEKNPSIILIANQNAVNKQVQFTPEIPDQREFIYIIITIMIKKVKGNIAYKGDESEDETEHDDDDNNNNNSISNVLNKFQLLRNDCYIPAGIILKANVYKANHKLGKSKRNLLLGLSQLFVFSEDDYTNLINIIPLIPFQIIIDFNYKDLSIDFILPNRKFTFTFNNVDEYSIWNSTLIDVLDKKLEEKIDRKNAYGISFENCNNTEEINNNYNNLINDIDKKIKVFNNKINEEVNSISNIKIDIFTNK